VEVNGVAYNVKVTPGGAVTDVRPTVAAPAAAVAAPEVAADGIPIVAPLAGNIFKIKVAEGQSIAAGEVVMVLEAMKMETEVRASVAGIIGNITVKEGDAVQVGETLLRLA
jgi:oxaloacetate decarboxylase alpha subunit